MTRTLPSVTTSSSMARDVERRSPHPCRRRRRRGRGQPWARSEDQPLRSSLRQERCHVQHGARSSPTRWICHRPGSRPGGHRSGGRRYSERLAYLLKDRAKSGVSLAALNAGEAAYEAEIAERRTTRHHRCLQSSSWPPQHARSPWWMAGQPDPCQYLHLGHPAGQAGPDHLQRSLLGPPEGRRRTATSVSASPMPTGAPIRRSTPTAASAWERSTGRWSRTNTWPIYRDMVFESRAELQPSFEELIDRPDPGARRRSPTAWTASQMSGASSRHLQDSTPQQLERCHSRPCDRSWTRRRAFGEVSNSSRATLDCSLPSWTPTGPSWSSTRPMRSTLTPSCLGHPADHQLAPVPDRLHRARPLVARRPRA